MSKKKKDEDHEIMDFLGLLSQLDEDQTLMLMMMSLYQAGVTPEDYAEFCKKAAPAVHQLEAEGDDAKGNNALAFKPFDGEAEFRQAPKGVDDADSKTLLLRIQMKDVKQPPMWREFEIPAGSSFTALHYAIQAACNFDNSHLWAFTKRPYDHGLVIGIPMGEDGYGVDDCTYHSDDTPLTAFLAKEGDKLVYTYDFGDDWLFDVTVRKIIDRKSDHAVLSKWKSDLQPVEDSGGTYAYCEMRALIGVPKKDKAVKQAVERLGYDDYGDLMAVIDDNLIDPDYVNERMGEISQVWDGPF